MSLSVKLAVIFSGIILVTGLVSFYGIYNFQNAILEKEITEKLEKVASNSVDRLDRTLYEKFVELDRLVAESDITSKNASPLQIKKSLEAFQSKHKQYAAIYFFNTNREKIATEESNVQDSGQQKLDRYWKSVLAGESHIVYFSKPEREQLPNVYLVNRVEDGKGIFLGLLVAKFGVQNLHEMISGQNSFGGDSKKYRIDILDRNGLVLYSNHEKDVTINEIHDDFEIIKGMLPLAGGGGSMTHAHDPAQKGELGRKDLMAFARESGYQTFKGSGWILMVEYGAKNAFAPIEILGKKVLALQMAVSIMSALAILVVLMVTVIRPLKKLSDATAQLGKGDMHARVSVKSGDEIGRLANSFNQMALNLQDARERLAHTAQVALDRANMAERRIISISEETQQKIGQELHDDLGQHLTGVAFMAEVLTQKLKSNSPDDSEDALKITSLINEAIAKTRKLAQGLYPVELRESGLPAMLGKLPDYLESTYGIKCDFICEGSYPIDDPDVKIHLFRITQEAINNAIKHSGAKKITLKLLSSPNMTSITISDNGCGIAEEKLGSQGGGLGMHTMQYRAALIGATIHIGNKTEGGANVVVNLPAQPQIAPDAI